MGATNLAVVVPISMGRENRREIVIPRLSAEYFYTKFRLTMRDIRIIFVKG